MAADSLADLDPDADRYEEPVVDLAAVTGDAPPEGDHDGDDYRDLAGAVGEEPLTAAERWTESEGLLWSHVLEPRRSAVDEALYELEAAVREGRRPTAAEVAAAREACDRARSLLEEYYAALAVDAEPWGDGAGASVPYGVLREQLESAGYDVRR